MTDFYDNIDTLMDCAARCNVSYVLPGAMYLRSITRQVFLEFLAKKAPHLYPKMLKLYGKDKSLMKEYKQKLYAVIRNRMAHYGHSKEYRRPQK